MYTVSISLTSTKYWFDAYFVCTCACIAIMLQKKVSVTVEGLEAGGMKTDVAFLTRKD